MVPCEYEIFIYLFFLSFQLRFLCFHCVACYSRELRSIGIAFSGVAVARKQRLTIGHFSHVNRLNKFIRTTDQRFVCGWHRMTSSDLYVTFDPILSKSLKYQIKWYFLKKVKKGCSSNLPFLALLD